MTKPTKWPAHWVKTQISLGFCPVWSVFAVCSMGSQGPKLSSCRQRRLWSDWTDAQTDLSLRWAYMSFCWFCHAVAHFFMADLFAKIKYAKHDAFVNSIIKNSRAIRFWFKENQRPMAHNAHLHVQLWWIIQPKYCKCCMQEKLTFRLPWQLIRFNSLD